MLTSENIPETVFHELQQRFEALKNAYERLDSEADKQIVHWRYAEESAFELRADYFRRFNMNPGRLVDEEPIEAYIFHAYGYDALDQIIYDALFQTEEDPRLCTFYFYHGDRIELAEFGIELYKARYHLRKVGQVGRLRDENPIYYAEFAHDSGREIRLFETYIHDEAGRMMRVASSFQSTSHLTAENKHGMERGLEQQRIMAKMLGTEEAMPQFEQMVNQVLNQQLDFQTDEIYEYEGDTLRRIVAKSDQSGHKSERNAYEAPLPDQTDESLFEAARTSLHSAIIDHMRQFAAENDGRLYHLVLSYDAVADDGVGLVPGFEEDRQDWEQATDDRSYLSLMLTQSFSDMVMIGELPEDYERFLRIFRRDQRWDDIRKLMNQVARDLNDHDWSAMQKTTDDFIVFAYDHEAMSDFDEEIMACVPENKVRVLRERGWQI